MDSYEIFSPKDCDTDTNEGLKDGQRQSPPSNSPFFEGYAQTLINQVRNDLMTSGEEWQGKHQQLLRKTAELKREVDNYEGNKTALLNSRDLDISLLRGESSPELSNTWSQTKRDLDEESAALADERDKVGGRRLHSHLGPIPYFLVMAFLAGLEFRINLDAIQATFGRQQNFLSWGLAILIGILLLSFAHLSGRLLKQRQVLNLAPLPSVILWGAVGLLSVAAIAVTFQLRWAMIDTQGLDNPGEMFFYFFVNAAIFCLGFITAVLHYDASPSYQSRHRTYAKARKAFEREDRRVIKREREIQRKFIEDLKTLKFRTDRLNAELASAQDDIETVRANRKAFVSHVAYVLGLRLSAYITGNMQGRGPLPAPHYFSQDGIDKVKGDLIQEFQVG